MSSGFRLYDPTAEPRIVAGRLAPRLASLASRRSEQSHSLHAQGSRPERSRQRLRACLAGKRAGILDNGKANAGTLMLAVTKILQERYGVAEVIKREKPVAGPPVPEVLAALSQCDFVLVGSAD